MSTERFTHAQFDAVLRADWYAGMIDCLGLIQGEACWLMKIDQGTGIFVRSSIDKSGFAAATGEDSIRAFLVEWGYIQNSTPPEKANIVYAESKPLFWYSPLGSKAQAWTTRVPGWEDRLVKLTKKLFAWRKKSGNCKACGEPKRIFKVKKEGQNKGRFFAKCMEHNQFAWLTPRKESQ